MLRNCIHTYGFMRLCPSLSFLALVAFSTSLIGFIYLAYSPALRESSAKLALNAQHVLVAPYSEEVELKSDVLKDENSSVFHEFPWKWVYVGNTSNNPSAFYPNEKQNEQPFHNCRLGNIAGASGDVFPNINCAIKAYQFKLRSGNRALFTMHNALMNLQAKLGKTHSSIVFIGDSVGGQYFEATICNLLRNSYVKMLNRTVLRHGNPYDNYLLKYKYADLGTIASAFLQDFKTNQTFEVAYKKVYRPLDFAFLRAVCVIYDSCVYHLGLHWNPVKNNAKKTIDYEYLEIERFYSSLKKFKTINNKTVPLIILGATAQHFRAAFKFGYFPGDGPARSEGCGVRSNASKYMTDEMYDFRRKIDFALMSKLNLSYGLTQWNHSRVCNFNKRETGEVFLHFVPVWELSLPFHESHPIAAYDCTHFCMQPYFFEPIFDAIYLAFEHDFLKLGECVDVVAQANRLSHAYKTNRFGVIEEHLPRFNETVYRLHLHMDVNHPLFRYTNTSAAATPDELALNLTKVKQKRVALQNETQSKSTIINPPVK